ncbi:MAG: alanine dehydrogenase [Gammaproteobacteria bacterium]|nr:alanine dehydrogenase [Gammaproteobacteria bacterium]
MKTREGRVALVPSAAAELVRQGHMLFIEKDAGRLSGHDDEEYRRAGVKVAADAAELYGAAELLLKVKEPQPEEFPLLRPDHLLFCFLHLAAMPELSQALQDIGLTAVAFDTVQEKDGRLPLLAPMSDIAGRLAIQIGAHLLHHPMGGKGVLLGGLAGVERGHVAVLGAGVAGSAATAMAAAMGARVTVFDHNPDKLHAVRAFGANVTALPAWSMTIKDAVRSCDLLIGAVLNAGVRAPRIVDAETVADMEKGSVIVDISIDQGGCIETARPTTYADPVFIHEGVIHFCVANMPGAVPRGASQALSASLLPYAARLVRDDWRDDTALKAGINVEAGCLKINGVNN